MKTDACRVDKSSTVFAYAIFRNLPVAHVHGRCSEIICCLFLSYNICIILIFDQKSQQTFNHSANISPCSSVVARSLSTQKAPGSNLTLVRILYLCPPLKKEGHIALHMSVGMSVGRYVGRSVGMSVSLNLITQERFAPEASNLVGR